MRLDFNALTGALTRGLAPCYLVYGDEPLLALEAGDAIRLAAQAAGYHLREVYFAEKGFKWDELRAAGQSLSLFGDRRLMEVRLPSGKPGDGAAVLEELARHPPPDTIILVSTGKLERKTLDSAWVKGIEQQGVLVALRPIAIGELPAWLAARALRAGIALDPDAAEFLAMRVEGNLLAASQEIQKLTLQGITGPVTAQDLLQAGGDSARYDVYQLSAAAAAGEAARALHILLALKAEGVEPTLLLWALSRELRGLYQAGERSRLKNSARSSWSLAATPTSAALGRLRQLPIRGLLLAAARTDRIVKGIRKGDPWTAITELTASFAGALCIADSFQAG
jgi:DNA polymerase III subunit delta